MLHKVTPYKEKSNMLFSVIAAGNAYVGSLQRSMHKGMQVTRRALVRLLHLAQQ